MFNLAVLALFFVLCFSYDHKHIGRVCFLAYSIYVLFIVDLSGEYFYHITALMNTVVAYAVYGRYRLFSILSFLFIPVCFVGYVMYSNYHAPVLYDTLAVIITILQVLLLGARVMKNAVTVKGIRGRALVRIVNFDSFKQNHELSLYEKEALR